MQIEKNNELNNENIESKRGYVYENPDCDIYEAGNEYKIYFDLPGVEKEDINIKVEKGTLSLVAESTKKPEEKYEALREEISYSGYKRTFELGDLVDSNKINADYKNGTLVVTLPKKEEQKTKEIKIKVN
jgi:HSP20 family protein